MQTRIEHHGDTRFYAELHAARKSDNSNRLDGDTEQ